MENKETPPDLFGGNRSEGAALVVRDLGDTFFILCFGMGFHLVNLDAVERDFGLRVTSTRIDCAASTRRAFATTGSTPAIKARASQIFMTCRSTANSTWSTRSPARPTLPFLAAWSSPGRDALSIAPVAKIDDLRAIFREAQARHEQKLPERFAWMDNVNRVKELEIVELLDLLLDERLKTDPDSLSLDGRA